MNKATRTAKQLAMAEKFYKELVKEGDNMQQLGLPKELLNIEKKEISSDYEQWKSGIDGHFAEALTGWEAQGEPSGDVMAAAEASQLSQDAE